MALYYDCIHEGTGTKINHSPIKIRIMEKNMDFGGAIAALKQGKKVSRKGWNGKGMFLWLKQGNMIESSWCKDPMLKGICDANGGKTEGLPTICMKTADNKVLTGWLASQTDMLSEDWVVTE